MSAFVNQRYHELREEVEGTVVLAMQDASKFDAMAKKTRERFESNRPRAVLFEGPPGTGKVGGGRGKKEDENDEFTAATWLAMKRRDCAPLTTQNLACCY
jgi:hypothetical protein